MNANPTKPSDQSPGAASTQRSGSANAAAAGPDQTHEDVAVAGLPPAAEPVPHVAVTDRTETVQGDFGRFAPVLPAARRFISSIQVDVLTGPHMGESREVGAGHELIIGRRSPSDWELPNEGCLSRKHFQVNAHPDHGRLIDLQSTNGTVLNGEKVTEIDLQDGDRIQCGKTIFAIKLLYSSSEPDTGSTVEF